MPTQLNYVQNQVLGSRDPVDYNLFQGIGPRNYNTVDTQASGMQPGADQFIVSALGSHLYLRNPQYTINLTVQCHGTSAAATATTPAIPAIVLSSFGTWLDTDAGNKAISNFSYSGAINYLTNDQTNRNPDTREIISHTYNKDQCDKYHFVRSPLDCTINNSSAAQQPISETDWSSLGYANVNPNPLVHYSQQSFDNFPRKLNTSQWVVKNCTATITGGAALDVVTDNLHYPGEMMLLTSAGGAYYGPWSATVQIQYTFPLCDRLFDCIYVSEEARSMLIRNQDLTLNVYFDTYYINNWMLKTSAGGTIIDSVSKSAIQSSSIRHYGFTTNLPSTPEFTKTFYEWANPRTQTINLVSGQGQFSIDCLATDVLPPNYLIYGSLELWKGSNSTQINTIIGNSNTFHFSPPVGQINQINNTQFVQISGLRVNIDATLMSNQLDDDYFRRNTADLVLDKTGTFDEALYQKLTGDHYSKIYSAEMQLPGEQGGVPYLFIDTARLSLDGKVPLIRNGTQRIVRFSGNIALDPTNYTDLGGAASPFTNAVVQLYIYELRPSLLRLDPAQRSILKERISDEVPQMSDLEVQNAMAANAAAQTRVAHFNDLVGGQIGGSFWSRLKDFAQPLLRPAIIEGARRVGQYLRDNQLFSGLTDAAKAFSGAGRGGRRAVI